MVLVNTCAIREHAEQRVLGRVAHLNGLREKNPGLLLGVTGCMAQRMGEALLRKAPYVDLVMGPDGYRSLPAALEVAGSGLSSRRTIPARPGSPEGAFQGERPGAFGSGAGFRRELRRPGAPENLIGLGLGSHPAGVRSPVHLLHRPLRPGAREEPGSLRRSWRRSGRSPSRDHRSHPSGANRELLPISGLGLSPPSAGGRPNAGNRAGPLHLSPSERRDPGTGGGHGARRMRCASSSTCPSSPGTTGP